MIVMKDKLIVEEEIEIKGPILATVNLWISKTTVPRLDCLQQVQQRIGRQSCPDKGSRIDKPVSAFHIDRLATVGRRKSLGKDIGVSL